MSNIDYTGTGTTLSIIPYSEKIGTVHAFLNGVVIYTTPMSISFDYGRTWKPIGLDSDPTFVYEPETEDDLDVMIFTYGIDKHYVAYNDGNVYSLKFFDASLPKYLNTTIYDKGFFINKEHFIVQLIDSPNTVMYWFDALDLKNRETIQGHIVLYAKKHISMPDSMELKHYNSTSNSMNLSYWCNSNIYGNIFCNTTDYFAFVTNIKSEDEKRFFFGTIYWKGGILNIYHNSLCHNNTQFVDESGSSFITQGNVVYKIFSFNDADYVILLTRNYTRIYIYKIYVEDKKYKAEFANDIFCITLSEGKEYIMINDDIPILLSWKWQGIELFMLQYADAYATSWKVYNSPGSTKLTMTLHPASNFNKPDGYFPNGMPFRIIIHQGPPRRSIFIALTGSYLTTNGGLHNVTPVKGSNQTQQLRKINGDYSSAFVKDISPCLVAVNKSGVKEMYKICKDYDVVKGSLRVYDKTGTKGIIYGTTSYITQPAFVGYKERPDIPAGSHSLKELASILVNYIPSGTTRAMRPIKQGSDYREDIFPESYHFEGPLIGLYSIQLTKVESSAASVGIYYELRFNYINAGNGVYSSASDKTIVHSNVYKTFNGGNFKFNVGVKFI